MPPELMKHPKGVNALVNAAHEQVAREKALYQREKDERRAREFTTSRLWFLDYLPHPEDTLFAQSLFPELDSKQHELLAAARVERESGSVGPSMRAAMEMLEQIRSRPKDLTLRPDQLRALKREFATLRKRRRQLA